MSWTAGCASAWITVTPVSGMLAGGATTNVTVSINANANNLLVGDYSADVTFSDAGNGIVTRTVGLQVLPPEVAKFSWGPINPTQYVGFAIPVAIQARTANDHLVGSFAGPVNLSGWVGGAEETTNILNGPIHSNSGTGNWTLGYSFTPNTNVTITHVRHYFGTKVSIWTDGGVLLAEQSVSSVPGTWTETELAGPLDLTNGVTYRVGAYTGGAGYYWRTDMSVGFDHGTVVQSYETAGDAFPVSSDSARWWFVDLRYTVEASDQVAVAPSTSTEFVSGEWTGHVTVQEAAANMYLRADDGSGHVGDSLLFTVASEAPMGTPTTWLIEHGLTNGSPVDLEMEDSDNDGMPNWQEYIADTCPTSAQSVLRFLELSLDSDGVRLEWQGGVQARQILERTHDLTDPDSWTPVFTNEPPTETKADYLDEAGAVLRFYRIRVERP